MAVKLRLRKGGTIEAMGELRDVKRRILDLRPPMRVGAAALTRLIDDTFDQQRAPGGAKWQDIKQATKDARRSPKRGRGKKRKSGRRARPPNTSARILIDTGRLRRSWFARPKGRKEIEFGTNVPYAGVHQAGSTKKNIVARRMGPVRLVGTRWEFVTTGPAGRYYSTLRRVILDYIRTGRVVWR